MKILIILSSKTTNFAIFIRKISQKFTKLVILVAKKSSKLEENSLVPQNYHPLALCSGNVTYFGERDSEMLTSSQSLMMPACQNATIGEFLTCKHINNLTIFKFNHYSRNGLLLWCQPLWDFKLAWGTFINQVVKILGISDPARSSFLRGHFY